jgi:hypothetical protein
VKFNNLLVADTQPKVAAHFNTRYRKWNHSHLFPEFDPSNSKVHLASFNGKEAPIDVYLAGNFPEWQRYQTAENFRRRYVIALIELPAPHLWLFAGLYESRGAKRQEEGEFFYDLDEIPECRELNGRLVIHFKRPGRQSYLKAERWAEQMLVHEVCPSPMTIRTFPGYRNVDISFQELQHLSREAPTSWVSALSSVGGVYLLTDVNLGRLYVGSASGQGGIWHRWMSYANSGHGGNRELRALLKATPEQSTNWRFSILELADVTASDETVQARESHWKNILVTRRHGLNAN